MASLPSGGPCQHPPLPNKPGANWVEKQGGLPHMIDCVARAIFHTGRSKGDVSKAVALAIGAVENWAQGLGKVSPATRARAQAAVAELKAKGTASKAQTATKNLSDCGCGAVDLSTRVSTARSAQPVSQNALTMQTRRQLSAKGRALPGGRFPIRNHADVKRAIRAVGRARTQTGKSTPQERALVRRHIIRNAKRIGAEHLIPPTWTADGKLKGAGQ